MIPPKQVYTDHIYHYITLCETVICDSDGVTRPHIASIGAIVIFPINC
jgi:hypothetical protein